MSEKIRACLDAYLGIIAILVLATLLVGAVAYLHFDVATLLLVLVRLLFLSGCLGLALLDLFVLVFIASAIYRRVCGCKTGGTP